MTVLVVADGAEGCFELEMAASVEGLADEEDGAAVLGWLVAEEVDGEAEGVEDAAPLSPRLRLWRASGEAQFSRWCWREHRA